MNWSVLRSDLGALGIGGVWLPGCVETLGGGGRRREGDSSATIISNNEKRHVAVRYSILDETVLPFPFYLLL